MPKFPAVLNGLKIALVAGVVWSLLGMALFLPFSENDDGTGTGAGLQCENVSIHRLEPCSPLIFFLNENAIGALWHFLAYLVIPWFFLFGYFRYSESEIRGIPKRRKNVEPHPLELRRARRPVRPEIERLVDFYQAKGTFVENYENPEVRGIGFVHQDFLGLMDILRGLDEKILWIELFYIDERGRFQVDPPDFYDDKSESVSENQNGIGEFFDKLHDLNGCYYAIALRNENLEDEINEALYKE